MWHFYVYSHKACIIFEVCYNGFCYVDFCALTFYGPVAHLVERLICTEEVAGSSPVRSTVLY